jgi:GXWXG protein
MLGDWCGGEFDTDHRLNGLLAKAKWFGEFSTAAASSYFYLERA